MMTVRTIRSWQRRCIPRTLALLVVVWLNVAFQPCAMAYGAADNCPHCPAGMHDSGMASMPMDCGLLDPVDNPDLLKPSVKIPDGSGDVQFAVSASWLVPFESSRLESSRPPVPPILSLHGPPPNVLFCVYLN